MMGSVGAVERTVFHLVTRLSKFDEGSQRSNFEKRRKGKIDR